MKLFCLEFGIWNLEFGIWNLEFGIWNLEFGIWNLEFGIWRKREVVEGDGFEPSKAMPSDLQSDPFGRSGTPPRERCEY